MSGYWLVNKETNIIENRISLLDLDDVDQVPVEELLSQGDYDPGRGHYLIKDTGQEGFDFGAVYAPTVLIS